jgi:hypothetical protein
MLNPEREGLYVETFQNPPSTSHLQRDRPNSSGCHGVTKSRRPQIIPMIVSSRLKPRKRPASKPAKITGPAIVTASKPGRYRTRTEPLPDAEADARVAAFFARMGIKARPPG